MQLQSSQRDLAIWAVLWLLSPIMCAHAAADMSLAYETIAPASIRVGESATLRVECMDCYLESVPLPNVTGLSFEVIARQRAFEFVHGTSLPVSLILIKVTAQFAGVFTIPGLTPTSKSLGLEVVGNDNPNPLAWSRYHQSAEPPPPKVSASLPKGAELKAGGAAFVRLIMPTRDVYVGESVPVDIEVGVRPGIVTQLNGLPVINGGDFTLNNLSRQPERREELIGGSPFVFLTWHSVLAAVKPGEFSLAVDTPLTVKLASQSAEDRAFASQLGWPFSQILYNGIAPKQISISSPPSVLNVLPLPAQGRPADFSGAVGTFQVASDISSSHSAAGDPLTLRLHVTGAGNFDRVDAPMFSQLEHWKTYPAKSSFTKSDGVGYKGEKIFEQPLIPSVAGAQTIPGLGFSYFDPSSKRYERASTQPINVNIGSSLSDSLLSASVGSSNASAVNAQALRPDHSLSEVAVDDLTPLYFRTSFLTVSTSLALLLAGGWVFMRPAGPRGSHKTTMRKLVQLDAAARSGNASSFFELAKAVLLDRLGARFQLAADKLSVSELKERLGPQGGDIEQLWAVAAEVKYAGYKPGEQDVQRWLAFVRNLLLTDGGPQ